MSDTEQDMHELIVKLVHAQGQVAHWQIAVEKIVKEIARVADEMDETYEEEDGL